MMKSEANKMIRPLAFVAMPFGLKKDVTAGIEIDFDQIYENGILPAIDSLGIESIRGDEEVSAGIIMRAVYERLLLAEIVIADLTLQNPNVLYEVGVRHCARPRSTILMYAQNVQLPFDLAMVRAIPYSLENGKLTVESANRLVEDLSDSLRSAVGDVEYVDSPLTHLIPDFPHVSLPHDATEAFIDRVSLLNTLKKNIWAALHLNEPLKARELLNKIEKDVVGFDEPNIELIIDLVFAFRDIESWDDMIRISGLIPPNILERATRVREQCALALNRRSNQGDRALALKDMMDLINDVGDNPETCGIIGRIYKDQYEEQAEFGNFAGDLSVALEIVRREDLQPRGFLRHAIEWYGRGFRSDPREYYPGINEATLRFVRGDEEDFEQLKTLIPAVTFAVARMGGVSSSDYWTVATVLELQVLGKDWEFIDRTLEQVLSLNAPRWMRDSTAKNLNLIRETFRMRDEVFAMIDAVLIRLK